MQMKARMSCQPLLDPGMVVRTVVVQDQMNRQTGGNVLVNLAEELPKLDVAVTRISRPDHGTFQRVQRCEKGRGPVAFVIVSHGSATPLFHRQPRLGSVQGLDLRLLVDTQHHRFVRRIKVNTHYIRQFLDKALITGEFERFVRCGCRP